MMSLTDNVDTKISIPAPRPAPRSIFQLRQLRAWCEKVPKIGPCNEFQWAPSALKQTKIYLPITMIFVLYPHPNLILWERINTHTEEQRKGDWYLKWSHASETREYSSGHSAPDNKIHMRVIVYTACTKKHVTFAVRFGLRNFLGYFFAVKCLQQRVLKIVRVVRYMENGSWKRNLPSIQQLKIFPWSYNCHVYLEVRSIARSLTHWELTIVFGVYMQPK